MVTNHIFGGCYSQKMGMTTIWHWAEWVGARVSCTVCIRALMLPVIMKDLGVRVMICAIRTKIRAEKAEDYLCMMWNGKI
ncbi:MAG: hypothetical protein KUA37_15080 [Desulfomicrobium sp.]|nr:hypothetical protein [Desulfomicrobium sp.]MBV1747410.1 hypothetical protein [Desulfomicrobium sp.]